MELKIGQVVLVNHFSGISPFRSVIVSGEDGNPVLKLSKGFAIHNFFEGDPVVLTFAISSEVYVSECEILEIQARNSTAKLKTNETHIIANQRYDERFPVSLYCEIKNVKESTKRTTTILKNLSVNGMSIISKLELELGDTIDIDIFLENRVIPLKAEVVWKGNKPGTFEYGLKTIHLNNNTKNEVKKYLQLIKEEKGKQILELNA